MNLIMAEHYFVIVKSIQLYKQFGIVMEKHLSSYSLQTFS